MEIEISDNEMSSAGEECLSDDDQDSEIDDLLLELHSGKVKNFREFLTWWTVKHCVHRTHVSVLLKGIKHHIENVFQIDLNLPNDFRALLKTPRDVSHFITQLEEGRFANLGLKRGLERIVKQGADLAKTDGKLNLTMFLDGFSPYNKRSKKFWALLHKVEIPGGHSPVFMSGLYVGKENPADFNYLLQNFVDEFNELQREPFKLEGLQEPVQIIFRCAICDMPAKGDAKGVKYCGYGSCDNCEQVGQFVKSVVLPDLTFVLRTNEKFRSGSYGREYHKKRTALEEIHEIDMVLDFPADYLHLVLLGVTRRWMKIYLTKPGTHKLLEAEKQEAIALFKSVAKSMTLEFQWRPQNLLKCEIFKGKEYRYVLLYGGLITFKDILPFDHFTNFLNLSCAIRILSCPEMAKDETWLKRAEALLFNFVHFLKNSIGKEHCVRVVHGLLHLTDDVRRFGHLDAFSAFPYESFLASIKYLLKSPGMEIEQVIKRYSEQESAEAFSRPQNLRDREGQLGKQHYAGPTLSPCNQYTYVIISEFIITCKHPNNVVLLKSGDIIVVNNVVKKDKKVFLVGRTFNKHENLFVKPLESTSLNIVLASDLSRNNQEYCSSLLHKKCFPFETQEGKFIVLPLIH